MKLIALGDNCIDVYLNRNEAHPGGNAVNAAVHAARLGAETEYLGAFADDAYAGTLRKALKENGVRYDRCPIIPHSTTKQCIYVIENGERTFREVITGDSWAGPLCISERETEILKKADIIVSSVNAKIAEQLHPVEDLPAVFVYDFGEKEKYRVSDYYDLVCGKIDLAMFSCRAMKEAEFQEFCAPLHERGIVHILATMGSEGQRVSNGTSIVSGTVNRIVPHDTMGAGDSFLSAFVISLYQSGWKKGMAMPEAALKSALLEGQKVSEENCLKPGGFGI